MNAQRKVTGTSDKMWTMVLCENGEACTKKHAFQVGEKRYHRVLVKVDEIAEASAFMYDDPDFIRE